MQIYDAQGHRLSLTGSERAAVHTAAEAAPREVRTYGWTLLSTGCRPSEALALTADRVDVQAAVLTFASRKKRRQGVYRAVPVPATLLDALDLVHGLRDRATRTQLWTWSLKTAYTRVIEIMARAGIAGPQASPKGLRHGFGVACIAKGMPLNLVQRWLGHAQLSTTAISADAVGEEERHIAARLWT
jgi:integrase